MYIYNYKVGISILIQRRYRQQLLDAAHTHNTNTIYMRLYDEHVYSNYATHRQFSKTTT